MLLSPDTSKQKGKAISFFIVNDTLLAFFYGKRLEIFSSCFFLFATETVLL